MYTLLSRRTTQLSTRNAPATATLGRGGAGRRGAETAATAGEATGRKRLLLAFLRSLSTWTA